MHNHSAPTQYCVPSCVLSTLYCDWGARNTPRIPIRHPARSNPHRAPGGIGGSSFPGNRKRDPRCALGIVDWDLATGLSQHVGIRGQAEVLPLDPAMARTIFRRYFGPDESAWDRRFDDVLCGETGVEMVRIKPETVVIRDQSYKSTWKD